MNVETESAAMVRALNRMSVEMEANAQRLGKESARVNSVQGAALGVRHRTLAESSKAVRRHARRLAKLEADYRSHSVAMIDNSRKWIESSKDHENIDGVISSVAVMRVGSANSKAGFEGYLNVARANRAANISQAVNAAGDELIAVIERLVEDSGNVIEYCDWVATLGSSPPASATP